MKPKEIKIIGLIILIFVIVIGMLLVRKNIPRKEENANKEVLIVSLEDIFPNKTGEKIKYKEYDQIYEQKVTKIEQTEAGKEITLEYKQEDMLVEKTYIIKEEKVVEKGRYIKEEQEVSTIYPLEIIVGMPYEGMEWDSIDKMIHNKVTSINNGKITIVSITKTQWEEMKQTRSYENGKGLIETQ